MITKDTYGTYIIDLMSFIITPKNVTFFNEVDIKVWFTYVNAKVS